MSDWSEELSLDDFLAWEEEQAVAPLLADVALIGIDVHMPGERSTFVKHHIWPVSILIEEEFGGVDLPTEN